MRKFLYLIPLLFFHECSVKIEKRLKRIEIELSNAENQREIGKIEKLANEQLNLAEKLKTKNEDYYCYYTLYSYYNLGIAETYKGNYKEARRYFEKMLEICSNKFKNKQKGAIANALFGIAKLDRIVNEHDKAIDKLKRALEIYQDKNCCVAPICYEKDRINWCPQGEAITLLELCNIYRNLQDYNEALMYCLKSVSIMEEFIRKNSLSEIMLRYPLLGLSNTYVSMGRYKEAQPYLIRTKYIFEKINHRSKKEEEILRKIYSLLDLVER